MSNQTNGLEVVPPQAPEYVEQNVSMVQQLATAQIQSRYMMAARFPRNIDQVRQEMLKECQRPSFCTPDESKNGSSIAIYRVPRAKTNIEGVTIRFAEMSARSYRNLGIEVQGIGEDQGMKRYQVVCTDYETNLFFTEMVDVPKSIERSYAKDTDVVLSQRTNSYGKPVFTVIGTDDDLAMKRNALISKATRNLIMKHIPGWLVEECVDRIRETVRTKDAADPDAAKRKLYDAFANIGVTAAQLTEYLGHGNPLSPAELEDLRGYYSGVKEGYTTWKEVVEAKENATEDKSGAEQLDKLFAELAMTPAVIRRTKAKYLGRDKELVEWLTGEIAKKANDGGKKEEPANPTQPSDTKQETATDSSSTPPSSPATVIEAKPEPAKQQDAPKQNLAPAEEEGW